MKVTKEKAAEHRERILAAAARLFRERGYEGVGLAEIAKAAGLTHGAFYTHFASKEALFAEACEHALATSACVLRRDGTHVQDLDGFVDRYLDAGHVTARAAGCAMAALGDDAARRPPEVREAFARGLARMIAAIADLESGASSPAERRRSAIATASQLVGALVLARATQGTALEEEILTAVRDEALAGRS